MSYFSSRTGKELSAVHMNAPLRMVSFAIIIDLHTTLSKSHMFPCETFLARYLSFPALHARFTLASSAQLSRDEIVSFVNQLN